MYRGPTQRGLQYVSPPALGTHARLVIHVDTPRDGDAYVQAWRVDDRGRIERCVLDRSVYGPNPHFRIPAVPDSGELELTLEHTYWHDWRPLGVY